ncbi:SurA N-terminal domain-containing protein [Gimesia panareensis]|uniref:SurA N-terminal domain-containing protein n=1 Tax=Gimesia panareensis TaxID=2527978 RepID=UPI00118C09E1|nr:SurA N-terminal domain-containing protein [Gimesia panareensis]QDU48755.1 periplasmic folding chaperone [Gimesia panareensis]
MASPLELFRKNQKVLMVPLTILAMFAFIILGQMNVNQAPPILGMLFVGALFWFLGKDRGKGKEFAAVGVVIGFIVGYMNMPQMGAANVVTSSAGEIDQQQFQEMLNNRRIANQFVAQSYFASLTEEEQQRARVPQGALFGFPFVESSEDDMILEFLLRKEADKMQLVVSDDAISNYISRYTNNKLSRDAFQEVCQKMGVTQGQIYEILRNQLKARLAFQIKSPEVSLTPDQYWNFYKKFNVREELEVAALPVKDFEGQIPEPTDAEKQAFYENYKAVFPNQKGPGSPGLLQPPKVKVEYLLADYEETEKLVPPVKPEEIKAFYEENKETLYKNNPIPNDPLLNLPGAPTAPQGDQPIEAPKPAASEKTPAAPKESAAPKADKTESPAPKADSKPKPEATPKEKTESKDKTSALDSDQTTFVALLDEKQPAKKEPAKKEPAKKEPAKTEPAKNPADAPKPQPETKSEKKPETKPAAKPAESQPESATTAPPPLEPYRPLNDELKSEIRDQLLRERTLTLMKEKINAAATFMNDLSYAINTPDTAETPPTPKEVTEQLKKYAAKHHLVYNITPLMTAQELSESEKYPLGTAREPTLNEFTAQPRTVLEQLFGTPIDQLYTTFEAEDSFSSALISYWKIDHTDTMVPKFDDPEIQKEIVAQIKTEKARPLAQKRAEELQALITKAGDKEMQEALKGQTITGKKEGTELLTQTTESFSWLRTSTAGASNPFSFPRPELSTISAIDGAGNDFMEQVFDNLQDGGVGVALNADKSVAYVVKVLNRIPSTPGGQTAMYQEFLKTDLFFFFSPYLPMAQQEQVQTIQAWGKDLQAKYNVQKHFEQMDQAVEVVQE